MRGGIDLLDSDRFDAFGPGFDVGDALSRGQRAAKDIGSGAERIPGEDSGGAQPALGGGDLRLGNAALQQPRNLGAQSGLEFVDVAAGPRRSMEVEGAEVEIGRAVQQECRDRSRMPSSA